MKKLLALMALSILITPFAHAQVVTADQFLIHATPSPLAPGSITYQVFGTAGTTATRYYWVSAVYPQGETRFIGPVRPLNGPAVLGAVNYIRLSWPLRSGALSYNIVRTGSSAYPTTASILVSNTSNNYLDDKGAALSSYTLPSSNPPVYYSLASGPNGSLTSYGPFIDLNNLTGDLSLRVTTCIALLPSTGGTCDGRSLSDPQTVTSDFSAGVLKPVTLILGPYTINSAIDLVPSQNFNIEGSGINSTTWNYTGAGTAFSYKGTAGNSLKSLNLLGPSAGTGLYLSGFGGIVSQQNTFENLRIGSFNNDISIDGTNANNGTYRNIFINVTVRDAVTYGLLIQPTTAQYANLQRFIGFSALSNGSDGIRLNGSSFNVFTGPNVESNGGCGLNLLGAVMTQGNGLYGGDFESNTTADVCFGSLTNVIRTNIYGTSLASATKLSGSYDNPSNVIITQSVPMHIGTLLIGNEGGVGNSAAAIQLQPDTSGFGSAALRFQATGTNAAGNMALMPSGSSTVSRVRFYNNSDASNVGWMDFSLTGTQLQASVSSRGTGSAPSSLNIATLLSANTFGTSSNCSSSASPAVCGSAAAGHFVIAAGATTVTVNTTAVTANSQIFIEEDQSAGTKLSVTCNTGISSLPAISARTAATSFAVVISSSLATNPVCYAYHIVN